ncbi:membrane lipoprotein lipid attachment site-containing protein [Altericroceibacterium endophyticum]|uniref:Type IV secretion system putative lipoprotein virB7 n=1 Tax=Altericroceibacterium endophyticum TaxID=1808508 RepID=A0A6I4T7G5_9SPHN|nr:membrane lipoprotein lipid attachment site-containing protein [Altericroceibacterium endophyticum]MXO66767.1 lipoprotein [Altericroceibacterium endophyticum]
MMRNILFAATAVLALAGCSGNGESAPADENGATVSPDRADNPAADGDTGSGNDTAAKDAPQVAGVQPECGAQEKTFFSCSLENGKAIAVCLTDGAEGKDFAQYRYGSKGKASEMVWPKKAGDRSLTFASVPYSGGGEAQLSFRKGDFRYVVYSRVRRTNFTAGEGNDPEFSDGVLVMKNDKIIANHACEGGGSTGTSVNYDLSKEYLPRDDDAMVYDDH